MKELTSLQKAAVNSINRVVISLETKRDMKQCKVDTLLKEISNITEEIDKNKKIIEAYADCAYESLFPPKDSTFQETESLFSTEEPV